MTSLDPEVAATGYANSWGLDRIDQRALPLSGTYTPNPGVGGGGVDVYVIDTGLATQHPEFQGRVGNGYDFVDGDSIPQECGDVPHGTHVAGTIASTLYGVAPQSTIHGVRVLDCRGAGYVSDIIAGMDWVVGERSRIGRTVVANMSLGGSYNSALNAATANMVSSGVVTVAAAGNEADNASYHSPGSTPEAITVAASTSNDSDASYSNYGSIIDLYAPGSDIWSTYAYDPSHKVPTVRHQHGRPPRCGLGGPLPGPSPRRDARTGHERTADLGHHGDDQRRGWWHSGYPPVRRGSRRGAER